MKSKAFGWMLLLLGGFASGAAASDSCIYTPSPSDWRQQGEVYYRLVMDHTWLFVPTGHIQIQPVSFTFPVGGKVKVVASFSATPLPLFADPDLHSPKGTEPTYPAGSGFLDYWFWANFQPGTSSVTLTHTPNGSTPVPLTWTVNVQCNSPGGLGVAPESALDIEGTVGGSFEPASRTYGLTNSGSSTINYSISVSYPSAAGWLSLSQTSGSLGAGQSGSFTATVNSSAAGLAAGAYGATIEIHTSGTNPQTITRAVSLSIQPGPSLPPVISGRITTADGAPLEGVRMDGLPSVKWTDENGEYSVYVDAGWSGKVRPFKAGFSFSPPNLTYASVTAGIPGQNYSATPKTYTLSGKVTLDGHGLPGVAMTGLPGDPVTDQEGAYVAVVPFHWSGTVIPEAPGYELSPASLTYSEVGMDRVDEDYLATQRTVTLSGRVTYGSSGLAGVWLNGLPGSVVTAADGTYAAAVPYGASGTVTPGASGYVFSPPSLDFVDLVEDLPAQNYVASQAPPGSGRLWIVATSSELKSAAVFSLAGDMILVKPGTYLGVDVGSLDPGTVLISEAGADQTILEVLQFVVNMSDVLIEGFTFRTGSSTLEPLHITGSSNVRLRNCRFIAPGTAFGVRITNAPNLLIEGSVFSGYAGILLRTGSSTGTLTLRNNHFLNQTSGLVGGSNPSLQVVLENNLFRNIAQIAVDLDRVGSLISRNNLFTGNGTGMDVSSITGAVQLTQDTLVGNGTAYSISGAISVAIYNSILQGNNRGIDGSSSSTISIHHLMPWLNTSGWLYGSAHYILDESTIWEVNPQFVNAPAGDYHLAAGSPARGVGQGGADLGAYGGALGTAWKTPPGAPPVPPALLSILVSGLNRINPEEIVTLQAKASFENGYSSPYSTFNNVAQWSSSDPTVLESQGAGRFRSVRPGMATVTAQSGSVSTSLAVTVLAPALVLTAADTADPVAAGGTVTYELMATNHGEGIARHLQITTQLDAQTSFISASPAPDAGTSNRWTLDDLQAGETAGVSLIMSINADAAGATLSFSSGATADFAMAAAASEVTTVSGTPDLQVVPGITPLEVRPGGLVAATLTFRNHGSAVARDVIVEAIYPFGLDFRSAAPSPSSGTGTWFVGTLAPGETKVISIELAAAATAAGTLVLATEIRSSDDELMPADNQASASVNILGVADLEISVTDSPDPVIFGHPVLYEVTVTNQGPSVATGVTLLATLPDGLELVSAVPEQGSCSGTPPTVCQLGSLAAGVSVGLAITANPITTGTMQMDSSVSGNEEDPDPQDNLSSTSTEIVETATGLDFYTLPPCRVLDTRLSEALVSQVPRLVPVAGLCGVPATARAVALNVTVVSPSGSGNVSLWPADLPRPTTSVINFSLGQTRANNAIAGLATDGGGDLATQAFVGGGGTVHLILDVSGYFQ